jgi:hypothetical protein
MGHWGTKANQYLLGDNPRKVKKARLRRKLNKPSKWDVFLDLIERKLRKLFKE